RMQKNSHITEVFQRELTCAICLNCLIDPVTIGCGHSFCRPCLCLSWEEAHTHASCPECRKPSQQKDFKTNITLKNLVKARLLQFLSSEEQMCGTHREKKKMFCDVDKSLLCLFCSNSQDNGAHRHCPIEVAAEDHLEKILKQMSSLWKRMQENHRNLHKERRTILLWGTDELTELSESVHKHMPQPVNPELSAKPITGLLDRLNCF
uniref:Uncharacterized protein n=1 Tax=Microcebus murinus TaxID=30608 RepID=A0A8C6EJ07_MICMU